MDSRSCRTHLGDLKTGVGVAEAARGAELVIHAASDTPFGRADLEQTAHLLDAARGARHLLYVSIVGIDGIPYPYYKRKLACEQRIASSGIPYTILRATQFHELIASVARAVERLPLAPLPLDFRFQTVAAADVAQRVAESIGGEPSGDVLNLGGPEVLSLEQMAEAWKAVRGRPHRVVRLRLPGKVARSVSRGAHHLSRAGYWPAALGRVRRLRAAYSLERQAHSDGLTNDMAAICLVLFERGSGRRPVASPPEGKRGAVQLDL